MSIRRALVGFVALTAVFFVLGTAPPAAAEPATTPVFPGGASATRLSGYAFDTCDAPTTEAMDAWVGSRYRGVGIYIGGLNRTCSQANLSDTWVREVSPNWRIIPIYMGHQAPCTDRPPPRNAKFTLSNASSVGTADAADAVAKATTLGLLPGSAIYGDMENYDTTVSSCRDAVLRYLSSWTKELHRVGYLSGVYANLSSGAQDLEDAYASTTYARPDALWIARYDHEPVLTDWSGISDLHWFNHQRGKQYWGNRTETYGGVTMTIDSNRWDAPVATVAYTYQATSTTPLNARRGPSTANSIAKTYFQGATLQVICQTPGSSVESTSVWDKLTDGTYVTDYYVSTPSNTTYSPPLPRCKYPYQVTISSLNERLGPSGSYVAKATLPAGALAWVFCQTTGSKVFTTSVWDRLDDGYYVTDYYLATPSKTSFSKAIARC
jgi:uncharacterized protein YraI